MNKLLRFLALAVLSVTAGAVADATTVPFGTAYHAPLVSHNANLTILHSFTGGSDGRFPQARLMRDASGNLWGTTYEGGGACACGTIYELLPQSQSFSEKVVYAFGGVAGGGEYPGARLFLDKTGTFYGSTERGGYWGLGAAFEMTATSGVALTYLHEFTGTGDGSGPEAPFIGDPSSSTIYGTTATGGLENCSCGTVFALTPNQGYSILYSFGGGGDGSMPSAPLIMDSAGALYGTTEAGGAVTATCSTGCGTVFEISGGSFSTIYHFRGGSNDGADPGGGLMMDKNGVLYGTTRRGGLGCNGEGCGTVFALTPTSFGYAESVLYRFAAGDDGTQPTGNLVEDKNGVFYGTTSHSRGLTACGCGTVFALSKAGSSYHETILHAFAGAPYDGSTPRAGLVLYQMGNVLYGTTYAGGSAKDGTVFEVPT